MSPRGRTTPELEAEQPEEADHLEAEPTELAAETDEPEETDSAEPVEPSAVVRAAQPQPDAERTPLPGTAPVAERRRSTEPVDERQELSATLQAEVDEEREEHDEALHELMKEIRELREKRRKRKLTDEQTWELAEDLVERYRESTEGADLKRALEPIKTYGDTFREKLAEIVRMGLKLSAWSDAAFMVKYRDLFGRRIEDTYRRREQDIPNVVERSLADETGPDESSDDQPNRSAA